MQAEPGLICICNYGSRFLVRLDHRVPGDAHEWRCDLWLRDHWSAEEYTAHEGDFQMLDELLEKPTALDVVELQMVRDWLKALEGDETTFGNTPEDQRRMDAIRRRLSLEESRNG